MHAIGNALLGGAASSLCALECDAFNVPLGAANLDLSNKRLGAAAATLLAVVIKGNTTIMSLKCVQSRISHMVAQCLRWSQAPSLVVLASNRPLALAFASGPADTPDLSPSPLHLSFTGSLATASETRAPRRSPRASRATRPCSRSSRLLGHSNRLPSVRFCVSAR